MSSSNKATLAKLCKQHYHVLPITKHRHRCLLSRCLSSVFTTRSIRKTKQSIAFGLLLLAGVLTTLPVSAQTTMPDMTIVNICDRTAVVESAILAAIPSPPACTAVTSDQLAAIISLDLANMSITALRSDDFANLTGLTTLRLQGNTFTTPLPANLFDDLPSVAVIEIDLTPIGDLADIALTIGGTTTINIANAFISKNATGSDRDLSFSTTLSGTSATATESSGVLTITASNTITGDTDVSITANDGTNNIIRTISVTVMDICSRTAQVQTAILAKIPAISDCMDVTATHLAAITGTLNLSRRGITTLQSGDFADLTSLAELSLGFNDLTTIEADTFSGLTSLTGLGLNNNDLTTIEANAFSALTSLTTLNLENNDLTTIEADIFSGFTSLTTLDLSINDLTTIKAGAFSGLTNLTELDLRFNDLHTIEAGVFSDLMNLTELDLRGQALTTLEAGTFSGLTGLTFLSLADNRLSTLSAGIFNNLTNLTTLYLDRNNLTTIEANTFSGLSSLTLLELEFNPLLTTIEAGAFSGLSSLTTLDLDFHALTTLEAGTFSGLTSLTRLDLDNNALSTIEAGAFSGLSRLTRLDLNDNNLTTIEADIFSGLTSLTELNLFNNNLSTPEANTFSALINLTTLGLENNNLTTIETDTFSGLTNLTRLVLRDNNLTTIEANTFSALTNLTRLDLRDNTLTTIEANAFFGLTSLAELNLRDNSIATINANAFSSLSSLTELDLRAQALTTLEAGTFSGLTSLGILDLANNDLTALPAGIFNNLTNLIRLYLFNNDLTTIKANTFSGLSSLTNLDLDDNPLTTLEAGAFSGLSSLTFLNLDFHALTTLVANTFSGLTSLETLRLHDNDLSTIEAGAFSGLSRLTRLRLEDNALTTLEANTFSGLSRLNQLDLYDNNLTTLEAGAFSGLSRLTELNLYNNALSTLPAGLFNPLTNLTILRLYDNALTTIEANAFSGLTSLTILRLRDNALTTIEANAFSGLTSLTDLHLDGNPITTPLPADIFKLLPTGVDVEIDLSPIGDLTGVALSVGGTTTINVESAFISRNFQGNDRTLSYTLAPANTAVATATESSGVVTITGAGMGATTVSVTADDGNNPPFGIRSMYTRDIAVTVVGTGILAFDEATGNTIATPIVAENNGTDMVYVQLASAPTSDVTMTVMSSATAEGTVIPSELTFTTMNWNTRQAITVTAVPDNIARDDTFTVNFAITSGDGGDYPNGLTLSSVQATITDDDTAGFAVFDMATDGNPLTAITTAEAGTTTDTFHVALTSEPTGTVTVTVASDDPNEGMVTPATLTFTTTNWNARQVLTVTAVDDNDVDGDETYDVTLTPTGGGYDGVTAATVSVTNTDDDTASLSIADISVDEGDGTATLTVTLSAMVTAGTVEVDATTMGGTATAGEDYTAITSQTLTFVTGVTSQTLAITINDDNIAEGNETFDVMLDNLMLPTGVTTVSIATDDTATLTITDDDVTPTSITLSVSQPTIADTAGATEITVTATIDGTAVLSTTTDVAVTVGGGTATGGGADYTATPSTLTITIPALAASATGTFMIDPNTSSDNNETVMITGTAPSFTTINPATLTIVEAGILVYDAMSAGTEIDAATIADEASGTGTLYVQLASQPAGNVTLSVESDDTNEGTVTPATLTFSTTNWNTRQALTITAVPDNVDRDGDSFTVNFAVMSGTGNYDPATLTTLPSVTVTVTDDDTVGFTVDIGDGVSTSEGSTTSDTFSVVLNTQPTDTVTVTITGLVTTEHSLTPSTTLTFTATNWSTVQTLTLNSVDDNVVDGDQTYDLTLTPTGGDYAGVTAQTVSITNTDADTAELTIADTSVNEDAGTATVTVTLSTMVTTGDVTVQATTADGTATAGTDYTAITDQTLTITAGTISQTLDITISDDNIAEGSEAFTVMLGGLSAPAGVTIATDNTAEVTITDDETTPTAITLSVTPSTVVETADATEITVTATLEGTAVLPTATDVAVSVGGGTATSGTDYTAVPNFTLTIPALSLSATGTFMIDPADDGTGDNNETVMISGTAPGFTTINAATLTISEAGISVFDVASGGTSTNTITIADENSGTMTFYVRLISAPASDVTLTLTSSDTNEGTVTPATLTFTATPGATSWDTRQAVTITAVDDNVDRDDSFTVNFAVTTGDSGNYPTTLTIPSVTVTITDDDTAGIALFDAATGTDAPSITTTEGATTDSFYVALESEPTGTVTVTISGLRAEEHVFPPLFGTTLTFTPTGATAWSTRQEITLTGVNDDVVDGDQMYDLTLTPTGGGYDSVMAETVSITNSDDDTATVTIADMSVNEDAGTATVTVTLTPAVTAGDVMVDATTADGTATIAGGDYTAITSQTLTIAAGSISETLDITINDDSIAEGNEAFTVMLDNLMQPTGVTTVSITDDTAEVTIIDDDVPGLRVDTGDDGVTTSEGSTTSDTFSVVLNTQPTDTVTVTISGLVTTEHSLTPSTTLTFTTTNWSTVQTLTLNSVDDNVVDGDQTYDLTLTPTGGDYAGVTAQTVSITNTDADTAELTIADTSVNEDAGTATVTVTLSTMVTTGDVTVQATTADGTATAGEDYTAITDQTLTITAGTISQTLDITINDDSIAEGNETFDVMLGGLSAPAGVTIATDNTAEVTITDDETTPTAITLSVTPPTIAETAGATTITVTATLEGMAVLPTATDVAVSVGGGTATVTTDYTATPSTLTITIPALAASATQTFMITPVDDTLTEGTEGDEAITISGTATINGTVATVNTATLTIVEAGISVHDATTAGSQISTTTIAEASGTGTLYVQLASEPATGSSVTISVASSATNEGIVNPPTLTFSDTNWDDRQAITITAVDDNVDRDDSFMVNFAVMSGDGGNYTTSLMLPSVTVTITDDDTAGIALFDMATGSDAPSITTTEGATTDSFYVALTSEPTGTVTVTISGLVAGEHTSVPPSTLTFTPTGTTIWSTRQEITLTGVNDDVVDGDQMYDLTLTPTGGGYNSVMAETVSITNEDDDTATLSIADTSVNENAGTATLTVTLTPAVTAGDVMVDATTTDGTATIAGGDYTALTSETLTFRAGSTTQTLDITINNDNVDEGDEVFTVTLDNLMLPTGVTTVSITDAAAEVTITDDDTLSDTINLSVSPLNVAETAGATTITVTATIDGTAVSPTDTTVTVSVGGGTATSGTDYAAVTSFTLIIPALSASATQTFTIDPTEDTTDDNNETVTISGTAGGFTTVNSATLTIVEAGISVHDAMTAGSQISTVTITEASGSDILYVQLTSPPETSSSVTISVASSDTNEGTVSTPTLTFSDTNWNARQPVTVTAVDDNIDRENDNFMVNFEIMSGDGGNYTSSLDLPSVRVTVTDDDTAGITVDIGDGVTTSETGLNDSFTVVLDSQPTATVTVTISGLRAGEHSLPPFGTTTLTFTATNWPNTQTVTLIGENDDDIDGNQTYDLTLTPSGGGYDSVTAPTVSITNEDDDTAALSIADTSVNENAGTATVTVTLTPALTATGNVTVNAMTIDGTATVAGADYTAITSQTLTFATGDTSKTLDIAINNDNIDEIDETFTVMLDTLTTPATVTTVSITDATAEVTITDDDTAGIALFDMATGSDAPSITTTEGATTDSFYVALTSEPTGTVTVTISGLVAGEHTSVPPSTLTFTPTGTTIWSTRQEITLTGVNDDVVDGDQMYDLTLTPTGGGYGSVTAPTVSVTNSDDDTAALTITNTTISVNEDVGMAEVTITLTPAVTAGDVMVDATTTDGTATTAGGDYTALTSQTLTFRAGSTTQTLNIPINNDLVDEDNETFTVTLGNLVLPAAVTGDVSITDDTATINITDDDTASTTINLSVNPSTVAETAGATDITVTATLGTAVVLTTPTDVMVTVGDISDSATEGTDYAMVSAFTLTIPALSSSATQTFTIDPTDDSVDDNNEAVTISGTATINSTTATVNSATLNIVEAGILVHDATTAGSQISTITIAEASNDILYVQLASQPATSSSVTISVTSDDTNEGTVTPATLTFSDTNWNSRQPVTVTAVDDNIDRDGDSFMVEFAVMSGDGGNYTSSLDLPSVAVTVTDDDTASNTINLSVSPDRVTETAGTTTITVKATLDGIVVLPTATDVAVTVGGGTATVTADYTATPSTLIITIPALAASATQTFMITPVADDVSDNGETITISGESGSLTVNDATLTIIEFSEEDQQAIEQTVAAQASGVTQVVTEQIGIRLASRTSAGSAQERQSLSSIDWQDDLAKFTYEGLKRLDSGADIMSLDWLFKAASGNGQVLMPLGAEALTLWATGGGISTKGDGVADYDGDVRSFILGIDTALANDWLVGVAISYNDSEVDYTMDGTPEAKTEQTLYGIHPYLSYTLSQGLTLWATGGYGFGDIDFSDTRFGNTTSDITQWMAAGGLEKQIITDTPWQGALRIKGLWGSAEVDATAYDNGADIRKVESTFWRARMESELGYNFPLSGANIRPYVLIGGRWDHNDAIVSGDEWHIDVGGGVELSDNDLALDISVRTQVTEGDTEEDSIFATGSLTYDLEQDGRGLQIALSRPLNNTLPAFDSHSFSPLTDTASGLSGAPLTSELAYGWTVRPFGLEGALQTYVQNSFESHDRHYAVGLELVVNALTLSFESGYHTNLDSETDGTGLESMFKTKIRW